MIIRKVVKTSRSIVQSSFNYQETNRKVNDHESTIKTTLALDI